jgi:hypothetical protein
LGSRSDKAVDRNGYKSSEQISCQGFTAAAPKAPLTADLFGKAVAAAINGDLRDSAQSIGRTTRRALT